MLFLAWMISVTIETGSDWVIHEKNEPSQEPSATAVSS